ncbi:uncharacterized protein PRCAT00000320001 [Priceomyces carsonii]|uniref:uncharacterized protein n=1 Tax=Priceomyces carsonii TaxID=28549 RepID=UPI002EDA9DF0|nr:unnamed protein product [Priceomyces carsonii]
MKARFPKLIYFFLALGIRLLQLLFTIIILGISAAVIDDLGDYDRAALCLATSVMSFVYLVFLLIPFVCFAPPLAILLCDSLFFILYLASFAALADLFQNVSCSATYIYAYSSFRYSGNWCRLSKALIGLCVINWVLFIISLTLLSVYTIYPLASTTSRGLFTAGDFAMGGIMTNKHYATENPDLEENPAPVELEQKLIDGNTEGAISDYTHPSDEGHIPVSHDLGAEAAPETRL